MHLGCKFDNNAQSSLNIFCMLSKNQAWLKTFIYINSIRSIFNTTDSSGSGCWSFRYAHNCFYGNWRGCVWNRIRLCCYCCNGLAYNRIPWKVNFLVMIIPTQIFMYHLVRAKRLELTQRSVTVKVHHALIIFQNKNNNAHTQYCTP